VLKQSPLILLSILWLALPQRALAFKNEPSGFGNVHLGMTVEQVKKILPTVKAHEADSAEAASIMAIYSIDNQTVLGLKGCHVDLVFDPEKLYQISFDCGRGVNVVTALEKRFGDPGEAHPGSAMWVGEHTMITLNTKARVFAFIDLELNKGAQARLMQYVMSHQPTPPAGLQAPAGPVPTPE
jgi:hypothetical protein